MRGPSRAHRRGDRRDGERGGITSYRDRIAGASESSRAPSGAAAFFGRDRTTARPSSGANLLTITAGHTLDVVEAVLGPIVEVDARTEIRWPAAKLTDVGEDSQRETADHAGVLGKTSCGAAFTADIDGGVAPEDAWFRFEITGSKGWLRLTGGHPYGFQAGDLELTSSVVFAAPEQAAVSGGFLGAAINVGEVYVQLVRDLQVGTYSTRGFWHALHNARLIEAVTRAAQRGEPQEVDQIVKVDHPLRRRA